ncbi:MAG TPA: hypothetical protein VIH72_05520 [Candidatus Acidoferrales bacterium]
MSVTLSDPKSRIDGAAASSTAVHATVTGVDAKGQMFRRPAAILILDGRDCTFRTDCQPEPNGSVLVEYDDRQSGIKRQVLHASVKATAPDTVSGFYKVTVQLEVAQTTKIFATSVEPRRVIETPNAVESGGVAESRNVSAKPSPSSQPANQAAQPASPAAKVGPALMTRDLLSTPPVNGASQPVARSIHQTIAEAKDENPTSMSKPQAENPIAMREAVRSAVAAELKQELAILKTWMSGEMERTVPGIIASNTEKIIRDNVEKHSAAAHEKTTQVFSAKVAGLVEDQIAGFRASLDSTVKKLAEEQAQLSQNAAGNSDKELTSRAATLLRSLEESASELTKKLLAEQTEFARTAAERADIELSSRAAATARSLEETTAAMARNVFEQQAELSRTAHSSAQHELDSHAATILRSLQESTSEMATKLAHEQAELLRNIHNDAQEDLGVRAAAIVRSFEESASETVKKIFQEQTDLSRSALQDSERYLNSRVATVLRSIEESTAEMQARIDASGSAAEGLLTKSQTLQREINEGLIPLQQTLQQMNEDNTARMENFRTQLDFELSRCSVQLENHFTNLSNQRTTEFSAEIEKRFVPVQQMADDLLQKLGAVFQLLQSTARVQQERLTEHSNSTAANFEREIRAILLRLAGG